MRNPNEVRDLRVLAERYVTELSLYVKELCPEAEMEISFIRYECEDAHIRVFPPSSLSEKEIVELDDQLAQKSIDILLEAGLLILVGIYEPHQRDTW